MTIQLISKSLIQDAVYWGNQRTSGSGDVVVDTAIAIKANWVEKQKVIVDESGKEIVSTAEVRVDRDLTKGTKGWGYLYLGLFSDLSAAEKADPMLVDGAQQIQTYAKKPTFRGTQSVRVTWL